MSPPFFDTLSSFATGNADCSEIENDYVRKAPFLTTIDICFVVWL